MESALAIRRLLMLYKALDESIKIVKIACQDVPNYKSDWSFIQL